MKLAADDVASVVIPGCVHHCLEEAPEEVAATLTAFLAPYRGRLAATSHPGPHTVDETMGVEESLPGGFLLTTVEKVAGYARKSSGRTGIRRSPSWGRPGGAGCR
jgi:hypothetical protein